MCGFGMYVVNLVVKLIVMGDVEVMVVGGIESMLMVLYLMFKGCFGYKYGNVELVDVLYKDGLEDVFFYYLMGCMVENLVEKYQVIREDFDYFVL